MPRDWSTHCEAGPKALAVLLLALAPLAPAAPHLLVGSFGCLDRLVDDLELCPLERRRIAAPDVPDGADPLLLVPPIVVAIIAHAVGPASGVIAARGGREGGAKGGVGQ